MFGLQPRLPVSEEERLWVDDAFARLSRLLGRDRMLKGEVIRPEPRYFPDPYEKSPESAERMFRRLCTMLKVDASALHFELLPDEHELIHSLHEYHMKNQEAAGIYMPAGEEPEEAIVVAVKSSHLDDPLALVATIVHELCHVILLGGGLLDAKAPDMEPFTDLATVFFGFGIFTANCAFRFRQFQDDRRQGWSSRRLGYLPEELYGYALARFAAERNEAQPVWAAYLTTNVRAYFKRSAHWLKKHSPAATSPDGLSSLK
jgi:hypothetical protein